MKMPPAELRKVTASLRETVPGAAFISKDIERIELAAADWEKALDALGETLKMPPNIRVNGWDERDYELWSDLMQLPSYGLIANDADDPMLSRRQVIALVEKRARERYGKAYAVLAKAGRNRGTVRPVVEHRLDGMVLLSCGHIIHRRTTHDTARQCPLCSRALEVLAKAGRKP